MKTGLATLDCQTPSPKKLGKNILVRGCIVYNHTLVGKFSYVRSPHSTPGRGVALYSLSDKDFEVERCPKSAKFFKIF